MNLYILMAMMTLPMINSVEKINLAPESETAVNSNFIYGNWRVLEINKNGYRVFSRDAYYFFNDNTGYQGRNQKVEWELQGSHLLLTTYNNGQINQTKWNARKDYKDHLILTRFESSIIGGNEVTKIIKIKLLKQ